MLLFKNDSPPLIWMAARPRDVATPNTVTSTAIMSIDFAIHPFVRSPISGSMVALIVPGAFFRNLKKARVNAMSAYTPYGCKPQWKKVNRSDSAAAAPVSGSPVAGSKKWDTGSARSEEHTSELQSRGHLVCRLLLE